MGKKTLYHPVSVNVLRGALEFCGIIPARLRQTFVSEERMTAIYNFELKVLPKHLWGASPKETAEAINSCFASDVDVIGFGTQYDSIKKREKIWIRIQTRCQAPFLMAEEAEAEAELNNVR